MVLVVLVVLELGTRTIADQLPSSESDDSEELVLKAGRLEELGSNDVPVGAVFIGSSAIDAGVAPAAFDAASSRFEGSYNAGLIGTPLATQQRWTDEVVLAQVDPEVAVVAVSPLEVHQNREAEALAPIDAIFDASFREIEDGLLPSLERWAEDRSALVRYRGSLRDPQYVLDAVRNTVGGEPDFPRIVRPDGYWEENLDDRGAVLQYRDRQLNQVSPELITYLDESMAAPYRPERLEGLLDTLDRAGVPAVVVAPPIALDRLSGAGADAQAYLDAVGELAATVEGRGLPFLDFSTAYDDGAFADPLHLNGAGTERFSRDLATAVDEVCAALATDAGCS